MSRVCRTPIVADSTSPTVKTAKTYTVEIHMAGDIEDAKRILRRDVYPPNNGLCVTVAQELFVYTGGEEHGFCVTLRNYPRFPSSRSELLVRATKIANTLIRELHQWTAMIVTPANTKWISHKPSNQR